ncbi:MAG: helix-turn-helix domain-containing protein [Methylobacter sp.]
MAGQDKQLPKAFGKVLRELRTTTGVSQEQLGFECGLDRTFISLLERGQRQPTLSTLFLLANKLQVTPSDMIRRVEEIQRSQS